MASKGPVMPVVSSAMRTSMVEMGGEISNQWLRLSARGLPVVLVVLWIDYWGG